jgi:hypothetical protein
MRQKFKDLFSTKNSQMGCHTWVFKDHFLKMCDIDNPVQRPK